MPCEFDSTTHPRQAAWEIITGRGDMIVGACVVAMYLCCLAGPGVDNKRM